MVNLKTLRRNAAAELGSLGNDSPLADVDYILMHMLGFTRSELVLGDRCLSDEQEREFEEAFGRLREGMPVQYVAGGCEFMSLWFGVNSSTLIPRADTEILVEAVVERCRELERTEIFEIGTGSGCIAVSLAHLLPGAFVTSADISEGALSVAKENAKRHGVERRCRFVECDIMKRFPYFDGLPQVVVSNPPYIPEKDILGLDKKVRAFEPVFALDGGEDGLDFYRRISEEVPIAPRGILAFEVGINQAQQVCEIMSRRFCEIEIIRDLGGIERVVLGKLKE